MKKNKIIFSIVSIALCVVLVGCASGDTSPMFDEFFPWTELDSSLACTEVSEYEFSRYITSVTVNDVFLGEGESKNKVKLNSSGSLRYTLKEGVSLSLEGGEISQKPNSAHTLLITELEVVYKDNLNHIPAVAVRNLYTGKKDTVTSYAVLDRYNFTTLFSYQKTEIEAQAPVDTLSFSLSADYSGEITGEKKAKYTDKTGTKTMNIKSGSYYDTQSLYYAIRAMRSVKTTDTTTRSFSVASPYDDILASKRTLKAVNCKQSTDTSLTPIVLKEPVYNLFDISEKSETLSLDCLKTAFSLDIAKSGPPINLYYSSVSTKKDSENDLLYRARKLLVMVEYPHHDKATNSVYQQEYVLSGYSNNN